MKFTRISSNDGMARALYHGCSVVFGSLPSLEALESGKIKSPATYRKWADKQGMDNSSAERSSAEVTSAKERRYAGDRITLRFVTPTSGRDVTVRVQNGKVVSCKVDFPETGSVIAANDLLKSAQSWAEEQYGQTPGEAAQSRIFASGIDEATGEYTSEDVFLNSPLLAVVPGTNIPVGTARRRRATTRQALPRPFFQWSRIIVPEEGSILDEALVES
jgi:hypothetical protein